MKKPINPEWQPVDPNSESGSLSLEDIQKAIDWLESDEYQEKCRERNKANAFGEMVLGIALDREILTEMEYLFWWCEFRFNGVLLIDVETYRKIEPIIKEVEKEWK